MLIHEAIEFAAVKHKNQVRKGTDTPYIVHPMEVMYILAENGCDETVIAAGLLHDTVEDAGATLKAYNPPLKSFTLRSAGKAV